MPNEREVLEQEQEQEQEQVQEAPVQEVPVQEEGPSLPDEDTIRKIREQEEAARMQATSAVDLNTLNEALRAIADQYPDAVAKLQQVVQTVRAQQEIAEAARMRAIFDAHKKTGAPIDYLEKHSATPQELEAAVKAYESQRQAMQAQTSQPSPAAQSPKQIPPSRQVAPAVGRAPRRLWSDLSPSDMASLIAKAKQGQLSTDDLP